MQASFSHRPVCPRRIGVLKQTACKSNTSFSRNYCIHVCKAHAGSAPSQREVVVGIDLGTTNSAVAYIKNGKPVCIPNHAEENTTPSVVCFTPDGDVVVGSKAKRLAATHPGTTYYSVKRIIGRQFEDPLVQEELPRLAYKAEPDESGGVKLVNPAVGRGFIYPEEVSAQVLSSLLDDAEARTGCGRITKAVISVPAYFNSKQWEATANAGKLAGLEAVRIIREPVAAALAYGLDLKEDATVLVFDLGGGTFDVSILEVGRGTVEVLATGGDAHLGGDDWDAALVEWLKEHHLKGAKGLDLQDPHVTANLKQLAELAKIQLSTAEEVTLRIPGAGPRGQPLEARLSRAEFDELSSELWRRCRGPLDQACWVAGVDLERAVGGVEARRQELRQRGVPAWKTEMLTPVLQPKARAPVSKVLLVGGATRMPAVRTFIRNMTGQEPAAGAVHPDEAVALGAAVQAGVLQGQIKDVMVMDQWQASLMRALAGMQMQASKSAAGTGTEYQAEDEDLGDGHDMHEEVEEVEEGSVDGEGSSDAGAASSSSGMREAMASSSGSMRQGLRGQVAMNEDGGAAADGGLGGHGEGALTSKPQKAAAGKMKQRRKRKR